MAESRDSLKWTLSDPFNTTETKVAIKKHLLEGLTMSSKKTQEIVNVVGPFKGLPGFGRLCEAENSVLTFFGCVYAVAVLHAKNLINKKTRHKDVSALQKRNETNLNLTKKNDDRQRLQHTLRQLLEHSFLTSEHHLSSMYKAKC